jgi:lysine 6-dehydrogenase
MKIVVLGGYGEMGRIIVTDLAETFKKGEIVVAGRSKDKAMKFANSFHMKNVKGVAASSTNKAQMKSLLKDANVLINATNYYSNLEVMKHALDNNVNYVDLGGLYWVTKEQLKLHNKFKKKNLIAVLGCGSTPGITNVLAEFGAVRFDRIASVDIAFADKDYTQYNQPFVVPYSMQTVFDEFTKNPPILQKGRIRFEKALMDVKYVEFPKPVGRVPCRLCIHSELASLPKALRDKGIKECSFRGGWDEDFIGKTKFLIYAGFASDKPVMIGGKEINPRGVAVALLNRFMPPEKLKINDMEFLRVEIKGRKNEKSKTLVVYCQAFTNKKHNIPAGSWDTGVPPSIIAQEIIKGQVKGRGVMTPESCIKPSLFFKALKKRKMKVFTRNK